MLVPFYVMVWTLIFFEPNFGIYKFNYFDLWCFLEEWFLSCGVDRYRYYSKAEHYLIPLADKSNIQALWLPDPVYILN